MLFKAIIIVFLIVILYALGSALFYLTRDQKRDHTRIVKALAWRIGLSLILFAFLFISFWMGWVTPHTI
jgi:hypothetical protein